MKPVQAEEDDIEMIEEETDRMKELNKLMDTAQKDRYEKTSNTANLTKMLKEKVMKKAFCITNSNSCSDELKLVVAVLAKVYAGELVEEAKKIQYLKNEEGRLKYFHVMEAKKLIDQKLNSKSIKKIKKI
jgi:hypothetical protein